MADISGKELEDRGAEVFTQLGLICAHGLNQVPLKEIDPSGAYSSSDHLEFDFLIPVGKICLIGEIKGGKNVGDIKSGYTRFKKHFTAANNWKFTSNNLKLIGVPNELHRHFRQVNQLKGFYIVANLQKFDVDLSEAANVARFFKVDWNLLREYAEILGPFARPHFLGGFDLRPAPSIQPLEINHEDHSLLFTENRMIASAVSLSDVFTFEASPYQLLPIAKVFRRDELPDLSTTPDKDFQRPLISKKLKEIRNNLLAELDFMFPNSVLGVLSKDCSYEGDIKGGTLRIPAFYGALSIIDGQHRLFSYADKAIEEKHREHSKILVTAIKFNEASVEEIERYSARTFVEINTNQTRVQTLHLDAIAYDLLGRTDSRALAAKVILLSNDEPGHSKNPNSLFGIFKTNQTELGVIASTTVVFHLKSILELKTIGNLVSAKRRKRFLKKTGYEALFNVGSIDELCQPDVLIRQGVVCLTKYFKIVEQTFPNDWPKRNEKKATSLALAKMIAAFVKLLNSFISEGLNWNDVEGELKKIRDNVKTLRGITKDDQLLFVLDHPDLPTAQPSASSDHRFLQENRTRPTSIQKLLPKK